MDSRILPALQLALTYKILALLIEFVALFAQTLFESYADRNANFVEIVEFSAVIIFRAEFVVKPYFLVSGGIFFAVALLSRFNPFWTAASAGLTFFVYWYSILSTWNMGWLVWAFGILQVILLSAVAFRLAWKVQHAPTPECEDEQP